MISHLLFVDDTMILCKPKESHPAYLRCILVLFEVMSGLKINLSESVLIPIGEVPELNNLAYFFGCDVDYLPSSYLSLLLGATFFFFLGATYKCQAIWELVVERFRKKLIG